MSAPSPVPVPVPAPARGAPAQAPSPSQSPPTTDPSLSAPASPLDELLGILQHSQQVGQRQARRQLMRSTTSDAVLMRELVGAGQGSQEAGPGPETAEGSGSSESGRRGSSGGGRRGSGGQEEKYTPKKLTGSKSADGGAGVEGYSTTWLYSPVPRHQTRNPLPRHPDYDQLVARLGNVRVGSGLHPALDEEASRVSSSAGSPTPRPRSAVGVVRA